MRRHVIHPRYCPYTEGHDASGKAAAVGPFLESDRKTARQIILAGRCYELTTTTTRRTKRRGWFVALKVLEPFGNLVLSR